MSLATKTPVEIDTELAALFQREQRARMTYDRIQHALRDPSRLHSYNEQDATDAFEELRGIIEQILPLESEYERRPWQRYWHVTNASGHIHRSMACSSCFPDTQYAWRTDLSGLTDVEVVKREAHNACTICMPIAPAEQKAARKRYTQEQREAKAAARQAEKDAKAVKARQRAVKHVDKVEAAIEALGGIEVLKRDYSLYGHDGRESLYRWTWDGCAEMVGQTLCEIKRVEEDGVRLFDLNEHVKAELTKRGLI